MSFLSVILSPIGEESIIVGIANREYRAYNLVKCLRKRIWAALIH